MHIFISYAKRDTRDLALRIHQELEALPGVTAWMDESLETGQSWAKQIEKEIIRCDCFVVLLSQDMNRDETADQSHSFVINEIELAQDRKKLIIPVMAQVTTRPVQIITLQYIDFTQNQAAGMQRLIADVKRYLPEEPPVENIATDIKPVILQSDPILETINHPTETPILKETVPIYGYDPTIEVFDVAEKPKMRGVR